MTQALLRYGKAFLRWYWNRVKEVPLVVGVFTLGAAFGSVAVEASHLTPQAVGLLHDIIKAGVG